MLILLARQNVAYCMHVCQH